MFAQASSNLICLLVCICDAPHPEQDCDVTIKPAIRAAIDIESSQPYALQVLTLSDNHTTSKWIYPDWMWSRDAIAPEPGPLSCIIQKTMSLNLDRDVQYGIGDGTFILGSPDSNF